MNILIAGVGGQGTLLAARVLGRYAELKGFDCKLSEVHGMAQRGGSVVTYVKMADKVYSPIIAEGDADIVLAFEKLEALRWLHCLKEGGKLIANMREIMPLPVIIGAAKYPDDIEQVFSQASAKVSAIDALSCAIECGNAKAVNTVMLGKLTTEAELDVEAMKRALKECVPAKALDINVKAFEKGCKL